MKIAAVASLAAVLAAGAVSTANAQTVLNTDLANASGVSGDGVATTTTNANGTTTTVVGSGGDPNRFYQSPVSATWQQQAVGGGGTVGITNTYSNDGNGAAFFSTTSADSKADLDYYFSRPVALSSLTSLSFDFYRDSALSGPSDIFAPVMRLMIFNGSTPAGYLVSEYYYQKSNNPPEDTWVTLGSTLTNGEFWATSSVLGPTFATAGGVKNLQSWIDDNAGTLYVVGVNIGVGSGWAGTFTGAVDHVQYAFSGGPSADFDFAVAPGGVPEPAAWAMMLLGFLGVGSTLRASRRRAMAAA
ncbi:MAG: hypothetical protein GC203_19210 [Phenylobacterium sp.]|uniref:PEPxxWA-CTERM sorting domain-containing protein n=1 Tax=Phenylobacterium sp. TaxID=1871053 RepID=UPI0025E1AB16|nr:PEPxxWA-CTERM sorting domain-containing protein [Phenylobacterium sp.]MBI1199992.1 hypothetical protein [Phenylobacterium sp.]